jgi:YegS/Rv2252/BmrU family lipid kinase
MKLMKIRFVINPVSGVNRKPQKIVGWIKRILNPTDIKYDIKYTQKPGDGTIIASESVKENIDLVAVVGGDGTINEVGRGLIKSKVVLGVIPSGSGNGFARNFNIPLNQFKAIKLLVSPRIVRIDTGKINNHYFFNVAGFGLDASISRNFEKFGIRGPLPYFLVGTRAFLMFQPQHIKLILDNDELEISPLLVTIANGPEYGNGAIIAPSAKPDDGYLDVSIMDNMPIWKAVPNLYRLFNGTIDQMEGFRCFKVKSMRIERESAGPIQTDGNPHMDDACLNISTIPKSLRIAVGNDYRTSA